MGRESSQQVSVSASKDLFEVEYSVFSIPQTTPFKRPVCFSCANVWGDWRGNVRKLDAAISTFTDTASQDWGIHQALETRVGVSWHLNQ